MSKIEKALQKARGERSGQVASRPGDSSGRQMVTVGTGTPAKSAELQDSSRQIARMQETELRDPKALERSGIIHPEMQETGAIKAFREIRTRIVQKTGGRNCTVLVTSIGERSGTSLVALNLGVAFAFDAGKTAVVVDCNLRHPSLHRLVGAESRKGIVNYLEDPDMPVAGIIHPVGIPRLRVIPAGESRATAMEHFTSARMGQLMDDLKQRYPDRYILLDGPPMSQAADVHILADMCDYLLLVVPYGRVTETQIARALKSVSEHKVLGAVFNDDPTLPRLDWTEIVRTSPLYRRGAALLSAVGSKWRRRE